MLSHFTTVFMAFFAIMNPVANAPVFVGLTGDMDRRLRRGVAIRAVLTAFVIVAVFAVAGNVIFKLFGVTLPAFRITGGMLVWLVGFHMLQGRESAVHHASAEDNANSRDAAVGIAISPLAVPLLAGPGTIATAMNYAAGTSMMSVAMDMVAFGLICAVTLVAFLGGEPLTRVLGQNMLKVISRLMGLILAVIGTQMVIQGLAGALPLIRGH